MLDLQKVDGMFHTRSSHVLWLVLASASCVAWSSITSHVNPSGTGGGDRRLRQCDPIAKADGLSRRLVVSLVTMGVLKTPCRSELSVLKAYMHEHLRSITQ